MTRRPDLARLALALLALAVLVSTCEGVMR